MPDHTEDLPHKEVTLIPDGTDPRPQPAGPQPPGL